MSVEGMMRPIRDKMMSEIDGKPSLQEMGEISYRLKHNAEISKLHELVKGIQSLLPLMKEQRDRVKSLQNEQLESLLNQMNEVIGLVERLDSEI